MAIKIRQTTSSNSRAKPRFETGVASSVQRADVDVCIQEIQGQCESAGTLKELAKKTGVPTDMFPTTVDGPRTNEQGHLPSKDDGSPIPRFQVVGNVSGRPFDNFYPHHINSVSHGRRFTGTEKKRRGPRERDHLRIPNPSGQSDASPLTHGQPLAVSPQPKVIRSARGSCHIGEY